MTTITATLVWILAEINLLMLILLGTALFIYFRNKRRDTRAVTALVKSVKENEPQQVDTIRTTLVSQYGQDEGAATEAAKKLIKLKKRFYKKIINIYIDKRREAFTALDQYLDELVMSYRTQMPIVEEPSNGNEAPAASCALTERTDNLSADVEELKRQNEQLKHDLEQAKQELESTLTEYVSAYSGGAELGKARLASELDKIKQDHQRKGILEEDEHAAQEPQEDPAAEEQEHETQDDGKHGDSDIVMSLSDALEDTDILEEPATADRGETV